MRPVMCSCITLHCPIVRSVHIFMGIWRLISSLSFHHISAVPFMHHMYHCTFSSSATLSPHPHIHHIIHIWVFDSSGHVLTQQFYSYVCIFLKYQGPSNFFNSSLTSGTSILCVLLPCRLTPTFSLLPSQMIVGCTYCLPTKLRNQCFWDGSQMLKT